MTAWSSPGTFASTRPGTADRGRDLRRGFFARGFVCPIGPSDASALRNSCLTFASSSRPIVTNSVPRSARNFTRRSGSRDDSYASLSSFRIAGVERMSVSV
jgi:hypothetical protein